MQLIKYMQAAGVLAFIFCIGSMVALVLKIEHAGIILFFASLVVLLISLIMALIEILLSGVSLKMELDRTLRGK